MFFLFCHDPAIPNNYVRMSPASARSDAQFHEPLAPEQLADRVRMNRSCFSTVFSQQYIVRCRLYHAAMLLLSGRVVRFFRLAAGEQGMQ